MIWFNCKKCGKAHGRAESSAGTMIFCDCGHGNTVPWESTAAEPSVLPVESAPRVPDLAPIQFDPLPVNMTPAPPGAKPTEVYAPGRSLPEMDEDDRPYRRGRTERRDPDYCFNHQRRPRAQACADCEESFCADCLVKFQGVLLCAACKNFRARRHELPTTTSTMASASLIISLIAGPIMMCLLLSTPSSSMRVLSYLSMLPQLVALGLGIWALRDAERENKGGGQWVAVSGIATAALTCIMILLSQQYANRLVS